jgi:hypothetical protein
MTYDPEVRMTRFLVSLSTTLLLYVASLVTIGTASIAQAETAIDPEQLPPWMQPEQLALIVAVDMDDPQKATFKDALSSCVSGLPEAIQRTLRKGGADLPKKIKRAVNREFSKFDKTMRKVLREEQTEAWGAYMAAFKTTMNDIMASRMRR